MKAQIKKVAIMPNVNKIESICYVEKIATFLWQNDVEVMIEKRFNEFLNNQKFVFVDKEETLVENSDIVIAWRESWEIRLYFGTRKGKYF